MYWPRDKRLIGTPCSRVIYLMGALALSACQRVEGRPGRSWPPVRLGYSNPIPAENGLAGDVAWSAGVMAKQEQLAAYGSRISARAGQTVEVRISSETAASVAWSLYRLGYYGGAGARLVRQGGPVSVAPQPACPTEAGTALVRCSWSTSFVLGITQDMLSGLYALKLIRNDGRTRFVPLIVTDSRPADLLFQASVQTYEAYNAYGGESLYVDSSGTIANHMAPKVSFDRPFDGPTGLGQMLNWEAAMASFLERYGYDVSYVTNVDVALRGAAELSRAGMFLTVGHDEYWTGEERDAVQAARDTGVPLGFFSANTGYWKMRYDDFAAADNPRTLVCYKAGNDPLGQGASGLFRGPGVDRPENALLGVMYESWQLAPFAYVVADGGSWLYQGTGLATGDVIPGIVGYEFDHRFANHYEPEGLAVLGRSPVVNTWGLPSFSEAVAYRAHSSALVFASGTIYWARALDPHGVPDVRVARMTANVLHEALALPVPSGLQSLAQPTAPSATMAPFGTTIATVLRGLDAPAGIAVVSGSGPAAGNIVIALAQSPQILMLRPGDAAASVLAGDGIRSGDPRHDGVPGAQARFQAPVAVATDISGRVYVADSSMNVIRRIDSDPQHTTITFAGTLGQAGNSDDTGTFARFRQPDGLAVDGSSGTLYVADTGNHRIRAIDLATAAVTTVAGSEAGDVDGPAATARFRYPTAVTVAPDGRVFVLSSASSKVKMILTDQARTVVTLAGGEEGFADGAGSAARLSPQAGIAWVGTFLAVSDGPSLRVRAIVPGMNAATTRVYTLAGSGRSSYADGAAATAAIGLPLGLATGPDGNLYLADAASGAVRIVRVVQ